MASTTPTPPAKPKRAIKFSALEQSLIDLLPRDGRTIDSNELVKLYYTSGDEPINARTIIIGRLRGIATKAERAGLPWRVRKSPRAGPKAAAFWIVKV